MTLDTTNPPSASVVTVRVTPLWTSVTVTVAAGSAAPDGSRTVPTILPVVLWENAEVLEAKTRHKNTRISMRFDGECMCDLQTLYGMDTVFPGRKRSALQFRSGEQRSAIGCIALTWPTSQVVLWSDHCTYVGQSGSTE